MAKGRPKYRQQQCKREETNPEVAFSCQRISELYTRIGQAKRSKKQSNHPGLTYRPF